MRPRARASQRRCAHTRAPLTAFSRRLLHLGANTSDIIDQYISTIKALRVLDPTGVMLETVGEPVRDYLRQREDTVRCIVASLTDDSNSELFEELATGAEVLCCARTCGTCVLDARLGAGGAG